MLWVATLSGKAITEAASHFGSEEFPFLSQDTLTCDASPSANLLDDSEPTQ